MKKGLKIANGAFKVTEAGGIGVTGYGMYKGDAKMITGGVIATGVGFTGATATDIMIRKQLANEVYEANEALDDIISDNAKLQKKSKKDAKKIEKLKDKNEILKDDIKDLEKLYKKVRKKVKKLEEENDIAMNALEKSGAFGSSYEPKVDWDNVPEDFQGLGLFGEAIDDDDDEEDDDDDFDDIDIQIPIVKKSSAVPVVKSLGEISKMYPNIKDYTYDQKTLKNKYTVITVITDDGDFKVKMLTDAFKKQIAEAQKMMK